MRLVSGLPVVVWDLGNVLIPWDRAGAMARLVEDPAERSRLTEEVFTMEVNALLDAGRPLAEVCEVVERDHPGHAWVVEGYVEHFRHSLGPAIEGSVDLLVELVDSGTRCVGLSNWSALTFEGIPAAYPALDRLEGILISGEVGVCKPDAGIYRRCEARFAFESVDAVFVDDSSSNVVAARSLGWDAIHFTAPDVLRAELAARGLVAPAGGRPDPT